LKILDLLFLLRRQLELLLEEAGNELAGLGRPSFRTGPPASRIISRPAVIARWLGRQGGRAHQRGRQDKDQSAHSSHGNLLEQNG
jgi:hypothetical protein